MKLALGAAQFGLTYGISNSRGKTSEDEVGKILDLAAESGISLIDTAPAYGNSEIVLGKANQNPEKFRYHTKTLSPVTAESLASNLEKSLRNLRINTLSGLLFHDPKDLCGTNAESLITAARRLQTEGKIKAVGVSVYDSTEIDLIINRVKIDFVQLPFSVLDQRLMKSGHLKKLKNLGIQIHVRSVFLQGLVFIDPNRIDPYFAPIKTSLERFRAEVIKRNLGLAEACLRFVTETPEVDDVICGVESAKQLQEHLDSLNSKTPFDPKWLRNLSIDLPEFVNPALWRLSPI